MSLVNTLMSGSGLITSYTEAYIPEDELFGYNDYNNYLESHVIDQIYESAVGDLIDAQEASLVADVIGEVRVIKEGADPQILMEGVFASIKDAIVKFFNKVGEFFKKLFSGFKKKAEENHNSEEAAKLREEINALRRDMSKQDLDNALKNGGPVIEAYQYADDPTGVYKKVSTELCEGYVTALTHYSNMVTPVLSALRKEGVGDSDDQNFKMTMGELKRTSNSATRFGYSDSDDEVKAAKKEYDYARSAKGRDALSKEFLSSAKSNNDSGYTPGKSVADAVVNGTIEELKKAYEEAKNPTINGKKLTSEEVAMGKPGYIMYLIRGGNTEKKNMTLEEAVNMINKIAGATGVTDESYVEFAIGGTKAKTFNASMKELGVQYKQVTKIRDTIMKTINQCEAEIKKNGGAFDNLKKILDQISRYTTDHVSEVMAIVQVLPKALNEIATVARATVRLLEQRIRLVSGNKTADNFMNKKDGSDYEKQRYADATRESAGLFEQAYSLGLF